MLLHDKIYGEVDVMDPVLLELTQQPSLHRLNHIMQHGISAVIGLTSPISRLEHSVGVMLLVKIMGGDLKEQIAALLHDISHTAFSHVIDQVFECEPHESYHEIHKERFLRESEIPDFLHRNRYDWRDFINEDNYPLLEQAAPNLCADRLDYFFRDCVGLNLLNGTQVHEMLDHLIVVDHRILLDDADVAGMMAESYLAADDASWSNIHEVGIYELTAQAIRRGLDTGELTPMDFEFTDQYLWGLLQDSPDSRIQELVSRIHTGARFTRDSQNPDFLVETRVRTIDPEVQIKGQIRRYSEINPEYARKRIKYLEQKAGVWPLRLIA